MNGSEIIEMRKQLDQEKREHFEKIMREFHEYYESKQIDLIDFCDLMTKHKMKLAGINLSSKSIYICDYCGKTELRDM